MSLIQDDRQLCYVNDSPVSSNKHTESYNVCPNYRTNQTQDRLDRTRAKEGLFAELRESARAEIAARFWSKVDRGAAGACWLAARLSRGDRYGHRQFTVTLEGTQYHFYAHRVAWLLTHGPIPADLYLLHRCDVAACVNPSHLFLGTQPDNLTDAREKGRLDETLPRVRGELTPALRAAIFAMPSYRGLVRDLARSYGVSQVAISHIRSGRFTRERTQNAFSSVFTQVPSVELPICGEVA